MVKYQYMQSAFHSALKPRARLVLNCLVLHANQDGECFPSIKTIAAECGYGVSTVKRALNDLYETGYLQKQARFDERKKGGQTSNLYILTLVSDDDTTQAETVSENGVNDTMSSLDESAEIRIARKAAPTKNSELMPAAFTFDFTDVFMWTAGKFNPIPP